MVPEVYPDSSFLFSLVTKDSHSPGATTYMAHAAMPLALHARTSHRSAECFA